MKVIDLDEFRKGNIKVKLGGEEYIIPEQAPLDVTLGILNYQDALKDMDIDKLENIIKMIYDVFTMHQPDLEYKKFKSLIDIETLVMIMNLLQGIMPAETKELIGNALEQKKSQSQDSGKE